MTQHSHTSMETKSSFSKELVFPNCQITQFSILVLDCLFLLSYALIHRYALVCRTLQMGYQ